MAAHRLSATARRRSVRSSRHASHRGPDLPCDLHRRGGVDVAGAAGADLQRPLRPVQAAGGGGGGGGPPDEPAGGGSRPRAGGPPPGGGGGGGGRRGGGGGGRRGGGGRPALGGAWG